MIAALATVDSTHVMRILGACGLLVVGVIVLGSAVWYYRRRLLKSGDMGDAIPWTLDDLGRMRDGGEITEEEYKSLRAAMIGSYGARVPDDGLSAPDSGNDHSEENGPDFDLKKSPQP